MTNSAPANPTIEALLAETTRLQGQAADPTASVWVSANAGTGKTHVLTQRVLRLLLSGTAPERILCLTYTKAAAAEMSKRVFDTLALWVGLDEGSLTATLTKLFSRAPVPAECALARTLFTRAIETPGGLKVQTIHAFCERLLQRFPLEAGVAPGFQILDDQTGRALRRASVNGMLEAATRDRDRPLGRALTTAIRYAADEQLDDVLAEAIAQSRLLDALIRGSHAAEDAADPFDLARTLLQQTFSVAASADAQTNALQMATVLDEASLGYLKTALEAGSATDLKSAAVLGQAVLAAGEARRTALASYFMTGEGAPRKALMTKGIAGANPALADRAARAQSAFIALDQERRALDMIEATLAIYRLADDVLGRYQNAKAARAALDFEDLIVRTAALLTDDTGSAAAWVLYKLDGGLDHILVDEAQDTAPDQWRVIEAIAREFFSDTGAGSRTGARTVFAVGDEKQSIYSFQGAAPEKFRETGRRMEALARGAGMPWHDTKLRLSFRTVAPVLATVDGVFADPHQTPGVAGGDGEAIHHAVKRLGQGGLVEIWPPEVPDEKSKTDAWAPLDETGASSPVVRLAARIADTIKGWLDSGERLASEDRPIRAGDILILVQKRAPFAPAVVAALKARKVAVAGADRIALTGQIGVQDLMVLGDFLTLPEDDLALATVLKSPLFGLDDHDLLTLAHGRKGTLWRSLLEHAKSMPRLAPVAAQLKQWRKDADFRPPFEFFAGVLDHDGGRRMLLERLGAEAADGIDEFLNLALTYDDQAPPSMSGFLAWLRESDREIKRDMDQGRDEVRVLTVHGAKGLEAPIVFLPDTCVSPASKRTPVLLKLPDAPRPAGVPPLFVWPVKGSGTLPVIETAKAARKARDGEELHRLLYVALTRPRDRLYIAGFQGRDALPAGCWYQLISTALAGRLVRVPLSDGREVLRDAHPQTAPVERPRSHAEADGAPAPPPAWLTRPAPREVQPAIPVAPSRLAPYDFDEAGEPMARPIPPPAPAPGTVSTATDPPVTPPATPAAGGAPPGDRFLRGTLTHGLLEHLPSLAPEVRQQAAAAYLDRRAPNLSARVRRTIATETLAILEHPEFAPLFGPGSLAEVPLVAELAHPRGKGQPLKLHGQIDRLAVTADGIFIIDYKTNRNAPGDVAGVSEAYLVQLAAYRLALLHIFPGQTVKAALLWTEIPRLMPIPSTLLDRLSSRIWDYGTNNLDVEGLSP